MLADMPRCSGDRPALADGWLLPEPRSPARTNPATSSSESRSTSVGEARARNDLPRWPASSCKQESHRPLRPAICLPSNDSGNLLSSCRTRRGRWAKVVSCCSSLISPDQGFRGGQHLESGADPAQAADHSSPAARLPALPAAVRARQLGPAKRPAVGEMVEGAWITVQARSLPGLLSVVGWGDARNGPAAQNAVAAAQDMNRDRQLQSGGRPPTGRSAPKSEQGGDSAISRAIDAGKDSIPAKQGHHPATKPDQGDQSGAGASDRRHGRRNPVWVGTALLGARKRAVLAVVRLHRLRGGCPAHWHEPGPGMEGLLFGFRPAGDRRHRCQRASR